MQKSESIAALAKALSLAQSEIKGAAKDGVNPHFRSEYSTLSSIWDACREALTKNGLSVVQATESDAEFPIIVETMLMHESGEWISGRLGMRPTKDDPQGIGSATTYARRYALAAMVGVAPEDDDAEGATGSRKAPAQSRPQQSKPQAVPPGDIDSLIRAEIKRVGRKDDVRFQNWVNTTWKTTAMWPELLPDTKKEILDSLLSMGSS